MSSSLSNIQLKVKISYSQILTITLPIAASILVPQLNFVINNIFLGHYSEQALAIAGITGVYYLIFAVIGNGLNAGLQSIISRRAGEDKLHEVGNIFSQGVYIAMALSIIGILVTWLIAPTILKYSLHNANDVEMATNFLRIRIFGLPFLYLYQMRNALLVGINKSKLLIVGTATDAIVNVIFDYGLIFGNLGMANMGFNGAAFASIIAEASGMLVIYFVVHKNGISNQLQLFKNFAYNSGITKNILTQSLPLMGQFALSIIAWEFFYILIEHKGATNLAISNAMRNIFGFFGCFTWALGSATNTMVSNVIGQGLQDKVTLLLKKIITLSVGFATIVCIVLNLFPTVVLGIYGQDDNFIQLGIPVLRVVSLAMVLMSISIMYLNAVIGTGNTKINLYVEMSAIVFYCTYVFVVLEKLQLSIIWGWGSEFLYWLVMGLPCYFYIHSNKWQGKKI